MSATPETLNYSPAAPKPRAAAARWCGLAARLIVAALFLLAAFGKLRDPAKFAEQIRDYQMAPVSLTNGMAYVIPMIEVAAAGLLVVGVWRREARWIVLAMLVVFTAAKIIAELRGLRLDCGCFGGLLGPLEKAISGPYGILLNVALIGLLVADARIDRGPTRRAQAA